MQGFANDVSAPSDAHGGRFVAIDGLRGLAAGMVVVSHAFPQYYKGGGLGVDLFFVISGFVITRLLTQKRPAFSDFYKNRVVRLLPASLVTVLFVFIIDQTGVFNAHPIDFLAAVFSFMNWSRAFGFTETGGSLLGHFWSLSVEEQFYFLWPPILLLLIAKKWSIRFFLTAALATILVWRSVLVSDGASLDRVYHGLDTHSDGLILGCILATLRPIKVGIFGPAALATLVLLGFLAPFEEALLIQIWIVGVAVLATVTVAGCAWGEGWTVSALSTPLMQWAGSRSYAIYLFHYPMLGICGTIGKELGVRGIVYTGVAIAGTLLAAELSYRYVETPARKFRENYDNARKNRTRTETASVG